MKFKLTESKALNIKQMQLAVTPVYLLFNAAVLLQLDILFLGIRLLSVTILPVLQGLWVTVAKIGAPI